MQPGARHGVRWVLSTSVRRTSLAGRSRTEWGLPTSATPFEGFPSPAAVPRHRGRCPPVVRHHARPGSSKLLSAPVSPPGIDDHRVDLGHRDTAQRGSRHEAAHDASAARRDPQGVARLHEARSVGRLPGHFLPGLPGSAHRPETGPCGTPRPSELRGVAPSRATTRARFSSRTRARDAGGTQHLRSHRGGIDLATLSQRTGARCDPPRDRHRLPGTTAIDTHPSPGGHSVAGRTGMLAPASDPCCPLPSTTAPDTRGVPSRPTSGLFSTDESVTSLRVATKRRSFLPWVLLPSGVPRTAELSQAANRRG